MILRILLCTRDILRKKKILIVPDYMFVFIVNINSVSVLEII